MNNFRKYFILILAITAIFSFDDCSGQINSTYILIPMDLSQTDHLKAYGVAFWALEREIDIDWLLNYLGGSFLISNFEGLEREMRLRGVSYNGIEETTLLSIKNRIAENNMEIVRLEKAPNIAVYVPPGKQPWDDAVRMSLEYAEIPHTTLWDEEVMAGKLEEF
ncbi:asparagine synthetase B, partial [candidate division KSB1 bacterium]